MGITAGIAFFGAVSISEQRKRERKMERAQEEASKVERATQAYEARKVRRQQIREARIRQAQIENISAVSGQTGSSAAVAASGSLQTKLATNIGEVSSALALSRKKSEAEQDIFDANRKSGAELLSGLGIQTLSIL